MRVGVQGQREGALYNLTLTLMSGVLGICLPDLKPDLERMGILPAINGDQAELR